MTLSKHSADPGGAYFPLGQGEQDVGLAEYWLLEQGVHWFAPLELLTVPGAHLLQLVYGSTPRTVRLPSRGDSCGTEELTTVSVSKNAVDLTWKMYFPLADTGNWKF